MYYCTVLARCDRVVFLHNNNISSALSQRALVNKREQKEIERDHQRNIDVNMFLIGKLWNFFTHVKTVFDAAAATKRE